MTISILATSREGNHFNLLRMIAACGVLLSHAYPIALGQGAFEPFQESLGMTLGTLAVLTFFVISGYFISQSFYSRNLSEFIVARVLRIYPGLFVVLCISVFVLGPFFTTLDFSRYFGDSNTLLYLPRNLRLWHLQYELPGVFLNNPYGGAINGSLWTLLYEVGCYGLVVIVGMLITVLGRIFFGAFLLSYAAIYITMPALLRVHPTSLDFLLRNVHTLTLPFVFGMTFFHYKKYFRFRPIVLAALVVCVALSHGQFWFQELFIFAWSYAVFYSGFRRVNFLSFYNRIGDYSYGTYIYAFPVEQSIATLYPGCTPHRMMILSIPCTLVLAIFSWHFVERPALASRRSILMRFRWNHTRQASTPLEK